MHITLWIVQSINCDDDEEEQAFATEAEAREDYQRRTADGEQCGLCTMRFDGVDRMGRIRTDPDLYCRMFNHVYDGWERHEYNSGSDE